MDVPRTVASKMYIAVDEIVSNILQYSGAGELTLCCEISPQAVMLSFSDNGTPYDPLAKPDPDVTLALDEREIGGLGIFMVKKSMDAMDYRFADGKNILTLKKLIV